MPLLKFCSYPGCRTAVPFGTMYCDKHKSTKREDKRKSANERGYTYQWQKASKAFLAHHPLCVMCEAIGIVKAAEVVDHIKPHNGNQNLFWDKKNWQPLCKKCHDRKTATEDGGFGREF